MITNKTIIAEVILALDKQDLGTFPLETTNDTSKNYAISFLIDKEMRNVSLEDFVNKQITPMTYQFASKISREDKFCFIPETVLRLAERDSDCSYMKAKFMNIESLLIESYDKKWGSKRISIQIWINKGLK